MRVKEYSAGEGLFYILCPACLIQHSIWTKHVEKPNWKFNGNFEKPTFSPSVNIAWKDHENNVQRRCHFFVVDGNIQFQSDCTHDLKGKTVPLKDLDEK